ncbi:hypothetical protein BDP27DRAFT_1325778 [Rhodocollybia butyracea]|uniref:SMAD/FHA domain-containing protein n=1 Tax=Rhodocollybia butyracea TaxID=206335 RepID=A0A9P5PTR3_9AGAR|nr:hypothetical protein BDP27DRAFT_1325778 [Rhodocollybia butyracea]
MLSTSPHVSPDSPPVRSTILGSFLGRGRPRNYHDHETEPTSPNPTPLFRGGSTGNGNANTRVVPPEPTSSSAPGPGHGFSSMLRRRRSPPDAVVPSLPPRPATASSAVPHRTAPSDSKAGPFRLRLVPHLESNRSLRFDVITRDMRPGDPVIRIGRFTDRNGNNTTASSINSNPHTFKLAFRSKVVSRAHAEIWVEAGPTASSPSPKFFIRDTGSSSGTYLNRIRLGAPGTQSRKYEIKDGDLLQLGVDYRGGNEDIYKSVKIRIELGREWQSGVNKFNSTAIKNLEAFAKAVSRPSTADKKAVSKKKKASSSVGLPDCCICLSPLTIRQSLFISGPCSHSFHFKCIRPLLEKTYYRSFTCPLCRTYVDLDENVEVESNEEEEDVAIDDDAFDVAPDPDADNTHTSHGNESDVLLPAHLGVDEEVDRREEVGEVDRREEAGDESAVEDVHLGSITASRGVTDTAVHAKAKAKVNPVDITPSSASSSKRKRGHGHGRKLSRLIDTEGTDERREEDYEEDVEDGEDVDMSDAHLSGAGMRVQDGV